MAEGIVVSQDTSTAHLHQSKAKSGLLSPAMQHFVASELMKCPPSPSGRIKRPPNCFILFAKDHRREIKRRFPHFSNKTVSSYLGKRWNQLEKKTKDYYYQLASNLSRDHKKNYPDYVYSPCEARKKAAERRAARLMKESNYTNGKYRMPLIRNKPVCTLSGKNESATSKKAKEAQELETLEVLILSTDPQTTFPSEDAEVLEEPSDDEASEPSEQLCEQDNVMEPHCVLSTMIEKTNVEEKETSQDELRIAENQITENEMAATPDTLSSPHDLVMDVEDETPNLENENPADGNTPMTEGTSHSEETAESTHVSSPATSDNGRPVLRPCVSGPIFDAAPFYPLTSTRQGHYYNTYYMPNRYVEVPVDSFRETQANSSMAQPSFSRAFDYSFPSSQAAVLHHNTHIPVYASPETSSVMAPRLASSSTQMAAPYHRSHFVECMPHVAGSCMQPCQFHSSTPMAAPRQNMPFSGHAAPEVNPCVPSRPFSEVFVPCHNMYSAPLEVIPRISPSQAAVPFHNMPLSNYMLAEPGFYVQSPRPYHLSYRVAVPRRDTSIGMHYSQYVQAEPASYEPHEASLPPHCNQPESITPNYSARIPNVMRNDTSILRDFEQLPSVSNP